MGFFFHENVTRKILETKQLENVSVKLFLSTSTSRNVRKTVKRQAWGVAFNSVIHCMQLRSIVIIIFHKKTIHTTIKVINNNNNNQRQSYTVYFSSQFSIDKYMKLEGGPKMTIAHFATHRKGKEVLGMNLPSVHVFLL